MLLIAACQAGPPAEPLADEALCNAACERVALVSAKAEAFALDRLVPGIAPLPRQVAADVGAAITACTAECVKVTPEPLARCMAEAQSPDDIDACASP